MRTDLTVRSWDATERDVAVIAPAGATFAAVADALAVAVPGAHPEWSGQRRLTGQLPLGRGPLVQGAVLGPERDSASPTTARLDVIGGLDAGRSVPIQRRVVVGRDPSCDLVLADPKVSRRHAEFTRSRSGLAVRDLGSTHGTSIDARVVTAAVPITAESTVRVGDTFLSAGRSSEPMITLRDGADGTVLVTRAPVAYGDPESSMISVPASPNTAATPRVQWIAAVAPAAAGIVLAAAMHSMQFLAFAALTPVALLAGVFGDRLHWRRNRRGVAMQYRLDLDRATAEIERAVREETVRRRSADPDAAAVRRIASTPTRRLWERHFGAGPPPLRVRVGLAELPSRARVDCGGVISSAATITSVPATIDLGAAPLAIAGPCTVREGLAYWILGQLAVLCSPADLEIAVLCADAARWRWLRWLPHVRGRMASTTAENDALAAEITDVLHTRRDARIAAIGGAVGASRWPGPWLVVVLDRVDPTTTRLAGMLTDSASVGVTTLCLGDHQRSLMIAGAHLVSATGDIGHTARLDSDNRTLDLIVDRVDADWADAVARALAPFRDGLADESAGLPDQCRLGDLLRGDDGTDGLGPASILRRWRRSDGSASALLGIGPGGQLRIDLARDGPHLLVAGTTGSGKSELLQTLVSGLALHYPPSEITILLVDYKGGAAFAECADLPHTVGMVTDLDERLTRRVLASLDSEIRRREMLLARAGVSDLAAYRATGAALPRLVLVIDEFATLAEELPDFVPGLLAVAQRGRSLGLHLVLATQRPAGVVSPAIRANTGVRICLRVTSAGESSDVLAVPDAMTIHRRTPGRAYLQIGTTTVAFQTARVAGAGTTGQSTEVRVIPLDSWRRPIAEDQVAVDTDLVRLVRSARAAAVGFEPPRRPWLPPLPNVVTRHDLPAATADQAVFGLVDLPAEQRRAPLALDLLTGGAVLIAGSPRSGRTTALRSIADAACVALAPAALHIHALDAGGSGLAPLGALPHVGTVATVRDGFELAARLVERLGVEFARRRDRDSSEPAPPRILVLVDGWEALLAASQEHDGGRTAELLIALLPDAAAARATVVITGAHAALAPRVVAHVATRLLLGFHDRGDYAAAGVPTRAVPTATAPGRGVRVSDGAEFQIARSEPLAPGAGGPDTPNTPNAAVRLRRLPPRIALTEMAAMPGRVRLGLGGDEAMPIGVELGAGAGRLVVAGAPRTGRSTTLCTVLHQSVGQPLIVAAPHRSPLCAAARDLELRVLRPGDPDPELIDRGLLLVDDVEAFADTAVGDALTEWVRADHAGRPAVVAARSDALAVTFRGLAHEVLQARCGILLQPGPVDGELLGVSLPRSRWPRRPGRGVLVPDPAWALGDEPLAIQLAIP